MNTAKVKEWVDLRVRRAKLEKELEDVKEDAELIELQLLEEMATEGVQNVKVDGVLVSHTSKKLASILKREGETTDEGYDRVCDMLIEVGLGHLVHRRFMTQTLTSWVNENSDDLPPEFEEHIRIVEKHTLAARGVKKKAGSAADYEPEEE